MNNYKNNDISEIIKSWSNNSNYPIDHPQKIIDTFADALTQIHEVPEIQNKTATNEEYTTIYNNYCIYNYMLYIQVVNDTHLLYIQQILLIAH